MSRRARKVFRATVVEGFGGLIFLMLVAAALPRLVDTGDTSAQDNAARQVPTAQPDLDPRKMPVPAITPPETFQQAVQQTVAANSAATAQPPTLWGGIGWEQNTRALPRTRVYLTDLRTASR